VEIKWESNDALDGFTHRIVINDRGNIVASEWVGWYAIANLELHGVSYRAVTMYYEGSFPTECVFIAQKVENSGR
jgi:hypothetical protein